MINESAKVTLHYPNAHVIVPIRSLGIFTRWEKDRTIGTLIILYFWGAMEW